MPKYVFEVSLYLPEGDVLTPKEASRVNAYLLLALGVAAQDVGHPKFETDADDPFEHVTGPDAQPIHAHV